MHRAYRLGLDDAPAVASDKMRSKRDVSAAVVESNVDALFLVVAVDTAVDSDMAIHNQVLALVASQAPLAVVPFERRADLITKNNQLNINKIFN